MDKWFGERLVKWYEKNGRDLPWRADRNPYKIWVSEIILQQTRVEQGTPYYHRIIKQFPNVASLAAASEDEVLKFWQGLGYYSRARNLHTAAQNLVDSNNGEMPDNYEGLRKMKGVGDYAAADIAALAYGLPYAAVDGNVCRVLTRVFGIETAIDTTAGKKEIQKLADHLLSKEHPAEFNQGMMDLGATVCLPKQPLCEECPFQDKCTAKQLNKTNDFPFKSKKIKTKDRFFAYLYIELPNNKFIIKQRLNKDIWQGLWEYPLIETKEPFATETLFQQKSIQKELSKYEKLTIIGETKEIKHQLSHQTLHARLIKCRASSAKTEENERIISHDEWDEYAIPRLLELLTAEKENMFDNTKRQK